MKKLTALLLIMFLLLIPAISHAAGILSIAWQPPDNFVPGTTYTVYIQDKVTSETQNFDAGEALTYECAWGDHAVCAWVIAKWNDMVSPESNKDCWAKLTPARGVNIEIKSGIEAQKQGDRP